MELESFQQRVHEWAEDKFGSARSTEPLFRRIKLELKELQCELEEQGWPTVGQVAYTGSKRDKIRIMEELADSVITILRFCGSCEINLTQGLELKQTINEQRTWMRHGDGTGRHMKREDAHD